MLLHVAVLMFKERSVCIMSDVINNFFNIFRNAFPKESKNIKKDEKAFQKYNKKIVIYDFPFLMSRYFNTDMLDDESVIHAIPRFIQAQIFAETKENDKAIILLYGMLCSAQNCLLNLDLDITNKAITNEADVQLIRFAKKLKEAENQVLLKTVNKNLYLLALQMGVTAFFYKDTYEKIDKTPVMSVENNLLQVTFKKTNGIAVGIEPRNYELKVIDHNSGNYREASKIDEKQIIPAEIGDTLKVGVKYYKVLSMKNVPGNIKAII